MASKFEPSGVVQGVGDRVADALARLEPLFKHHKLTFVARNLNPEFDADIIISNDPDHRAVADVLHEHEVRSRMAPELTPRQRARVRARSGIGSLTEAEALRVLKESGPMIQAEVRRRVRERGIRKGGGVLLYCLERRGFVESDGAWTAKWRLTAQGEEALARYENE